MKTAISALTEWINKDNIGMPVEFCDERKVLNIRMIMPNAGFTFCTLDVVGADEDGLMMVFEYQDYDDALHQVEIRPADPHAEEIAERVRLYINELAGFNYITR